MLTNLLCYEFKTIIIHCDHGKWKILCFTMFHKFAEDWQCTCCTQIYKSYLHGNFLVSRTLISKLLCINLHILHTSGQFCKFHLVWYIAISSNCCVEIYKSCRHIYQWSFSYTGIVLLVTLFFYMQLRSDLSPSSCLFYKYLANNISIFFFTQLNKRRIFLLRHLMWLSNFYTRENVYELYFLFCKKKVSFWNSFVSTKIHISYFFSISRVIN